MSFQSYFALLTPPELVQPLIQVKMNLGTLQMPIKMRYLLLVLVLSLSLNFVSCAFPFSEIIPPLGKISIYRGLDKSELVAEFQEQPAVHGVQDLSETVEGFVYPSAPDNACETVFPPPLISNPDIFGNNTETWILLASTDSGCDFEKKLFNANEAGFDAVIIYNVESNATQVISKSLDIPAFFVGEFDGLKLRDEYSYPKRYYIVIERADLFWGKFRAYGAWISAAIAIIGLGAYVIYLGVRAVNCSVRWSRSCGVCRENLPREDSNSVLSRLYVLPCSHKFHAFCMMPYSSPAGMSCPTCSKVFSFDSHLSSGSDDGPRHSSYESGDHIMITATPIEHLPLPLSVDRRTSIVEVHKELPTPSSSIGRPGFVVSSSSASSYTQSKNENTEKSEKVINLEEDSEQQPLLLNVEVEIEAEDNNSSSA